MSSIVFERVGVRAGKRELLSEISLTLEPGRVLALVGPNGAGKTTLLRAALGLVRPSAGRIMMAGRDVRTLGPRERARWVAWLPQHQVVSEALSVEEVVAAARFRFAESRADSERHARAALERVGASSLVGARVNELSGGERQRVFMAALLAQEARLMLMDEPASHLDPAHQLEAYRLLGELWRAGIGVLLVTHDVNLMSQLGPPEGIEVLGLDRGRVSFRCDYSAGELPGRLSALFGLNFTAISHAGKRVLLPTPQTARSEAEP
ncbi:MAG TPA: ABC transporter ATP-binding protein [Polyangiaceae bacterium]